MLPADVWKRWAPIILAFLTASVNGGTPLTQQLVKIALTFPLVIRSAHPSGLAAERP